jgi:hypothetical protein
MNLLSFLKSPYALTTAMLSSLFMVSQLAYSECLGKIEFAPAYIHVDVIEDKDTVKDLNMAGIRTDLNVVFGNGWVIKPSGIYGKENDGELWTASIGLGRCIPLQDRWVLTPSIGFSYTRMEASIELDLGDLGEVSFREKFEGYAPYIGLEVVYKISACVRFCINGQYAWSHTKTKVNDSESDGQGPSIGAMLEYDWDKCWSVNIGGAYNESFSREKNGLRAYGAKIGIVRWF